MADDPANDQIHVGLYSLLDDLNGQPIAFQTIQRNSEQIAGAEEQRAIRRLLWFSRGWYTITREEGQLLFHDMRFGRSDGWLDEDGDYIFVFELEEPAPGQFTSFERRTPSFDVAGDRFTRLWERMGGIRLSSVD